MLKVHKQSSAEKDLIGIWIYTCENWGVRQADVYLDAIDEALQTMAMNPGIGIKIDDIRPGYFKFQVKEHIIFYTATRDKINVIRVLNQMMDCARHL